METLHERLVNAFKHIIVGTNVSVRNHIVSKLKEQTPLSILSIADIETEQTDDGSTLINLDLGEIQTSVKVVWEKKDNGTFIVVNVV